MFQCAVLVSGLPYESSLFNTLETANEFTVLTIGYHVLILCFDELKVSTRENCGISMMAVVSAMILLNGFNWIFHLVR